MFFRTDLIVFKWQLGLLTLIAIYFDGLILVLDSRKLDGRIYDIFVDSVLVTRLKLSACFTCKLSFL